MHCPTLTCVPRTDAIHAPPQFLCEGLEEDITMLQQLNGHQVSARDLLVRSSSKMVVLDKLLGHLREQKRKVLIFSQFKMMLDVLEDYLHMCGYPFERLDGGTGHQQRQAAIRRFNDGARDVAYTYTCRCFAWHTRGVRAAAHVPYVHRAHVVLHTHTQPPRQTQWTGLSSSSRPAPAARASR